MASEKGNGTDLSEPHLVVDRIIKRREKLAATLAAFSFRWFWLLSFVLGGAVIAAGIAYADEVAPATERWAAYLVSGGVVGIVIYLSLIIYARLFISTLIGIQDNFLTGAGRNRLQETLEEDFFTKLVKINFKYIDQYYLQTQAQADKSFVLTCFVSAIGLIVIVAAIAMMLMNLTTPAYLAAVAGVITQFISAVFFYLYNSTVTKMAQYHQKLVITQNISLAMKIAEGLPEAARAEAQKDLVRTLTENVNKYLTEAPPSPP